ncbi:hypothetical protein ACFWM1_31905 [Nocardia sp. NPDC058379]|uniref:hypothetical protein n=1 Tax=unclassified Nocardia TaxID=2637762 RepID=UPI0036587426
MTAEDLRERVRAKETESLRSALGNTVLAVPWAAAIVGLVVFAPAPLADAVPEVPLSTWRTLVLFPVVLCCFGLFERGWNGTRDWYDWQRAHSVRLAVDRRPEHAALLIPPLEDHLSALRAVRGHRQVMWRRARWVVIPVGLVVAIAIWGVQVEEPDGTMRDVPAAPYVVVLVLIAIAVVGAALPRWRRWQAGATAEKWSRDPAYAAALDRLAADPVGVRAADIPTLRVRFVRPSPAAYKVTTVTATRNVFGWPPEEIAYLRLFDNHARIRSFLRGAWREFGYVHILRGSGSVSPAEVAQARSGSAIRTLFATSPRTFRAALAACPTEPLPPGRRRLTGITNTAERVHDPAGSYPVRALLCHGSFWQSAVDMLLARVGFVVVDLSGYLPANTGTQFELQRVIDRFPLTGVVLLCDESADRTFLRAQIHYHWTRMAAGSPNTGFGERTVLVAITGAGRDADRALMAQLLERRRGRA